MAQALSDSYSDFSDDDQTPLDKDFLDACNHVTRITSKLKDSQLLELYGFYKQSMEGKCTTQKPGWLDARGRRKWEAWNILGDLSKEEAKKKYIDLVHNLDPDCGVGVRSGLHESWVTMSALRYSPEPELQDNEMSLFDAAREDMGTLVTKLLSQNPELCNERDENGLTALHWAADRDATCALTAALSGGCFVDAVDRCDQTPLHYAALCGHARSTKILLEAGASFLKDDEGCTPLDLATDKEVRHILENATCSI